MSTGSTWTALRGDAPLPPVPDELLPAVDVAAILSSVMGPYTAFDLRSMREALATIDPDTLSRAAVQSTRSAALEDVAVQAHLPGDLLLRGIELDCSGSPETHDLRHVLAINAWYVIGARDSRRFRKGTTTELFFAAAWCPSAPGATSDTDPPDPSLLLARGAAPLHWSHLCPIKNPFRAALVGASLVLLSCASDVTLVELPSGDGATVPILRVSLISSVDATAEGLTGDISTTLLADGLTLEVRLPAALAFAPTAAYSGGWLLVCLAEGLLLFGRRPELALPLAWFWLPYFAGAAPGETRGNLGVVPDAVEAFGDGFLVAHYGGFLSRISAPAAGATSRKRRAGYAVASPPIVQFLVEDPALRGSCRLTAACSGGITRIAAVNGDSGELRVYELFPGRGNFPTLVALPGATRVFDAVFIEDTLFVLGALNSALYRFKFGAEPGSITELVPDTSFPKLLTDACEGAPLLRRCPSGVLFSLNAQSSVAWWNVRSALL
jgi:hypothetical protein